VRGSEGEKDWSPIWRRPCSQNRLFKKKTLPGYNIEHDVYFCLFHSLVGLPLSNTIPHKVYCQLPMGAFQRQMIKIITVEPRFNEPLFNEVLDITNDILCPGQSYSKMYGTEPRYNEFFDITNIIRKPKRKIYLDITNYNVSLFT